MANSARVVGWVAGVGVLLAVCLSSIAVGTKYIALPVVWDALFAYDPSVHDQLLVHDLRVGRTALGVLVGVAMAAAGTLMQAMTRNPLADPGLLGVNAGAAFCVALAVGALGLSGMLSQVWFAFLGAVIATVVVYVLGSRGRGGATPVRLTLVGVAVGALLTGVTSGLTLLDPQAFEQMRWWSSGSLANRALSLTGSISPFVMVGLLLAFAVTPSLNAMAMGDDVARALGANITRTRVLGLVAVTLMCGGATAAAGPIGFVGLMIPHLARRIVGTDQRWIMAYSLVGGPILVLLADIAGRLIVRPGEMPAGVVTAFVGAPVLIVMIRRARVSGL
nr:iron chelate uptake ABC transporter family permease subunit [Williamsia sterculiae]